MRFLLCSPWLLCLVALGACGPAQSPDQSAVPAAPPATVGPPGETMTTALSPSARPVLEQELAYGELGNRNLQGFLAMPADAAEPQPGILVIHEQWGLDEQIRAVTRRLAAEGYIVLAVDLYDGATTTSREQAAALMRNANAEPERILGNLQQAYEYLERYALSPRIGSVGWGFGGYWSVQAALKLPPGLDAAVTYYGALPTGEDLQSLAVPLLGFFGALDETIHVRDVQQVRNRLKELGADAEVLIYSDAGHDFARRSDTRYAPVAAEDAWRRTLEFFAANLRNGSNQ